MRTKDGEEELAAGSLEEGEPTPGGGEADQEEV
jgi:hypothetical protein